MFKVGDKYNVEIWQFGANGGGAVEYFDWEVVEVELPLVTFRTNGKEEVWNTSSQVFISAKRIS